MKNHMFRISPVVGGAKAEQAQFRFAVTFKPPVSGPLLASAHIYLGLSMKIIYQLH
jgi:hypothetical protein